MRTQRGFTLIELMVVLVVIAVLSAIALPSYTSYVTRGKIPNATSNLAAKRVQMEQWFMDNHTYVGAPACNTDTASSKYFVFSCATAPTTTSYTLQAVGTGSMAGFTYTVDQGNNQTTSIVAPAPSAWILATPSGCWVTKTGGVCD
ncbi:MAG TPA: type IV pilin protein [Rhodocyclaceae bacterium]|nr:type IV pilin protein [Rhodocyclaceae bacterium]